MRMKGLNFPVPNSINFCHLSPEQIEKFSTDREQNDEYDKEYILLGALRSLESDKQRCIFLFELLKEYGYQFDYRSLAKSVNIELRWFMRVKRNMQRLLKAKFNSHI